MSSTNIFHDGILLDVDVSFWSAQKNLTAEDLGLSEDTIVEAFKLGKKMLIPAEFIREFRTIEGQARRVVEINSFPFPIGNAKFVPKKRIPRVLAHLKECQGKYMALVEQLVENYEELRASMLPEYEKAAEAAFVNMTPDEPVVFGVEYDREAEKRAYIEKFMARLAGYYPPVESLRQRFSLTWSVYEIAIPRMRKGDLDEVAQSEETRLVLQEDYRKQVHEKIGGFVADVVSSLRKETFEICERIGKNIKEGKVVRSTTIESLRGFIDRFSELNFVGDEVVEKQLAALRVEFLDKHAETEFADDAELKVELGRRLGQIAESAAVTDVSSITGDYKRKVSWED